MPEVSIPGIDAVGQEQASQQRCVDKFPEVCPLCGEIARSSRPPQGFFRPDWVELFFRCENRNCGRGYIAFYSIREDAMSDGDAHRYFLSSTFPTIVPTRPVPASINSVSPTYAKIFGEALAAEQAGLGEIVGIALRRSLEVLIKDYAISVAKTPEAAYSASKSNVHDFLRRVLKGDISEKTLALMNWLGDDAFDYERRWRGENIAKLKTAIAVIEQVIATAIDVNSIERRSKSDLL
jgi:hypothetical protein